MKVTSRSPIYLALTWTLATANEKIDGPFMDPTLTEPCDYSCPEMSKSALGLYCPRDFTDCQCDRGTERDGDACSCLNAFECPPNSRPRNDCPVSVRHCVCHPGFELQGDECVCVDRDCMTDLPECEFECPYKSRSSGLECPGNFDDCACAVGYAEGEDGCICDSVCPENSVQKKGNSCPTNVCRHCDCEEGYAMIGDECEPKCDYLCPPDSKPKEGMDCASNFGECECAPGLKKVRGQCACDLSCPKKSAPNKGVVCPLNPETDCTCMPGFIMVDGKCGETDVPCFDCPENALLITESYPGVSKCFGTFEFDCFCDRGYEPHGETCVKKEAV